MSKQKGKKNNVIINIISQTIFIVFLIVSIALFGIVISLGILPIKYLIIGILVILLFYIGMGFFIFSRKYSF